MKIKTAQDYADGICIRQNPKNGLIKEALIESAKFHVEVALEEASKKAVPINGAGEWSYLYVDKDSILQSYPLTNIK